MARATKSKEATETPPTPATPEVTDLVFSPYQIEQLNAKLDSSIVKERQNMSYLEAWYVIQEANRIFGHGNWNGEIIALTPLAPETFEKNGKSGYRVGYLCQYRVTVKNADGTTVVKEDVGFGNSVNYSSHIDAAELASKEAVSDAIKRCMKSFGGALGLWLYDKEKKNVKEAVSLSDVTTIFRSLPKEIGEEAKLGLSNILKDGGAANLTSADTATLELAFEYLSNLAAVA